MMRNGVISVLHSLDSTVRIQEAGNCDEALQYAATRFDFILLDLNMPGTTGLAALERIQAAFPREIPVIVLSGDDQADTVTQALDRGAAGYVPKTHSPNLFAHAFGVVLHGGIYIPPAALTKISPPAAPRVLERLTKREREVFLILITGAPNKVIARDLKISEGTVKALVSGILRKLEKTRVEAVRDYYKLADTTESA